MRAGRASSSASIQLSPEARLSSFIDARFTRHDIYYDHPEFSQYCCDYSCKPLRCASIGVPFCPYRSQPFIVQSFFKDGRCDICGKVPSESEGEVAMTARSSKLHVGVLAESLEKSNDDYF